MPSTPPRTIYVVWSPVTGPVAAYYDLNVAARHADTMVGVDVGSCDLTKLLPALVLDDVVTNDYDVDDSTPVQSAAEFAETHVVDVDEG